MLDASAARGMDHESAQRVPNALDTYVFFMYRAKSLKTHNLAPHISWHAI